MTGGTPANPAALAFRSLVGNNSLEVVVPVPAAGVVPTVAVIVATHVVSTAAEVVTSIVA